MEARQVLLLLFYTFKCRRLENNKQIKRGRCSAAPGQQQLVYGFAPTQRSSSSFVGTKQNSLSIHFLYIYIYIKPELEQMMHFIQTSRDVQHCHPAAPQSPPRHSSPHGAAGHKVLLRARSAKRAPPGGCGTGEGGRGRGQPGPWGRPYGRSAVGRLHVPPNGARRGCASRCPRDGRRRAPALPHGSAGISDLCHRAVSPDLTGSAGSGCSGAAVRPWGASGRSAAPLQRCCGGTRRLKVTGTFGAMQGELRQSRHGEASQLLCTGSPSRAGSRASHRPVPSVSAAPPARCGVFGSSRRAGRGGLRHRRGRAGGASVP